MLLMWVIVFVLHPYTTFEVCRRCYSEDTADDVYHNGPGTTFIFDLGGQVACG